MKRTVLIVVMLAVVCATAAWSQGPPRGGGPRMGCAAMAVMPPQAAMLDGLAKQIALTADQAAALKTILTASDAAIPPLVQAAAEKSKTLRTAVLVPATEYDADAVAAAVTAAQEAESAVLAACIDTWCRIGTVLTKEQFTALQTAPPPGPGGPPPGGPPPGGAPPAGGRR